MVVFNGEIYNYQSLIPELQALGHRFRTRSDTEVIVHAWEAWGERCVERFRGMFAFALWDRNSPRRCSSRATGLGVKPLYYAMLLGRDVPLRLGAQVAARASSACDARSIPLAVEEYFAFGYVPEPRMIFKGIHKLPPAHVLSLRRGQPCRSRASTGTCALPRTA